eukprot:1138722-Prymnesium_polylepis.1
MLHTHFCIVRSPFDLRQPGLKLRAPPIVAAAADVLYRSLLWSTALFVCSNCRFEYHRRTA